MYIISNIATINLLKNQTKSLTSHFKQIIKCNEKDIRFLKKSYDINPSVADGFGGCGFALDCYILHG